MNLPSPLLGRRLLDLPPIGGRIKERPEDFLVDEDPLIEPSGQGEHLHMGVQKMGMTHDELVRVVARHCGVHERAVGHAGMKDRVAVTRQTISVHLPGLPDPPVLDHPGVQILWTRRHDAKLRPGQLRGNRFSIRIRGVDPLAAPRVQRGLHVLVARGVPNAYGPQRFGHRCNSHLLGALLALERWQELVDELCGAKGSAFPEFQREARARYDAGDFAGCVPLWARGDHAERTAARALADGRDVRRAVLAVRESTRGFWLSAAQSALFNSVLALRLDRGLYGRFVAGDVANIHPGRSLFRVSGSMLDDTVEAAALGARLERLEISPSGPVVGADFMQAEEQALALEREAFAAAGIDAASIMAVRRGPEGGRRSLRMRVTNPQVESGVDEHGSYVRVAFDLPRGGYATTVLSELMGSSVDGTEPVESVPANDG